MGWRSVAKTGAAVAAAEAPHDFLAGAVAIEERHALAGTEPEDDTMASLAENGPVIAGDPTQRLLTALGRFQRQVSKAESGAPQETWCDECMNQVVTGIETALSENWDNVREALTDTARVLQTYENAGRACECVPFLQDSYEILCLMVGDLIVDNVRSGVMQKWHERYEAAVAEVGKAGLVLVGDEGGDEGGEAQQETGFDQAAPAAAHEGPAAPSFGELRIEETAEAAEPEFSMDALDNNEFTAEYAEAEASPFDPPPETEAAPPDSGVEAPTFDDVLDAAEEAQGAGAGPFAAPGEALDAPLEAGPAGETAPETETIEASALEAALGEQGLEEYIAAPEDDGEAEALEETGAIEVREEAVRGEAMAEAPAEAEADAEADAEAERETEAEAEAEETAGEQDDPAMETEKGPEHLGESLESESAAGTAPQAPVESPRQMDIEEGSPEALLQDAQRAVARGDLGDAKAVALELAVSMAQLEADHAETMVHEGEVLVQKDHVAIANCEEQVRGFERGVQEAETCVADHEVDLQLKSEEVEKLRDQVSEFNGVVSDLDGQIRELEAKRDEEAERLSGFEADLEASLGGESRVQSELGELREAEEVSHNTLVEARQEADTMQKDRAAHETELTRIRQELDFRRGSVRDIERTIEQVTGAKRGGQPEGEMLF